MSRSSLIGSYSERTTCPHCGDRIKLEDVRVFVKPNDPYPKCPSCGTSLRVSLAYRRLITLIACALSWLISYFIGIRAYIVVAWVPFWVLACVLVPNFVKGVVPPELGGRRLGSTPERASPQRRAVHFALALLDMDPTFFGPNGKYGRQTRVSLRPVWFARTDVCGQDQDDVRWHI